MNEYVKYVILFVMTTQMSFSQNTYTYQQPKQLTDGWQVNNIIEQKRDTTRLYQFFNQLIGANHQLHSVLVVQKNELLLEEYFDDYNETTPHDLRSVTKSIRSLLVGIAIDKGFIKSIDDPIFKYLKQRPTKNLDPRKEKITIKDLLTMSTGMDCNDWDKKSKGQEDKVYKKKDWIQYTLNLPMINEPGTLSTYCSMGTLLLAEIISQASGMTIDAFAKQYLLDPMQITNVEWNHTAKKEVVASAKRLYLSPRAMAKIGQLILNEGFWNGEQLVAKEWIKEVTSNKTKITGMTYGYLWWTIPFQFNGKTYISKTATGNGGQYIMVVPELELVAVFTGGAYNSQEDKLPFAVMKDVLLFTFRDKN